MKMFLMLVGFSAIVFAVAIQIPAQDLESSNQISLIAKTIKFTKDEWQFEVKIKNNLKKSVYLTTQPVQVNGEKGHYLQLDNKDESLLKIDSRIFPPPFVFYYSNQTSVTLKRIKPDEVFSETISLKFPVRETSPPNGNIKDKLWAKMINKTYKEGDSKIAGEKYNPFGKKIIPEKIQSVIISYGYFVSSELDWKETVEFQKIISSNLIKIQLENEK